MAVIDTNLVIRKVKKNEDIKENITEVTIAEYLPIMDYKKILQKSPDC